MFIYLHDRGKPAHQGRRYPNLINLNHIESIRSYCDRALLWFHDEGGEERSFEAEESFESVVNVLEGEGVLIHPKTGKVKL